MNQASAAREVIGAVLAGGRSRRMGSDKATLELNGQTLLRSSVDALRETGLETALVLRVHQPVPLTAHTVHIVRDAVENAGPLGGLQALLRWLPSEWALVASCDQPFLAPELLREMLAQRRGDVDADVGRPTDLMEPLPGLYRRTCLPAVERALARGERSFRDLLSSLRVRAVPVETLRRCDAQLLSYVNVNTQADLARARATAAAGETPV